MQVSLYRLLMPSSVALISVKGRHINAECTWHRVQCESVRTRQGLDSRTVEGWRLRRLCITQHEAERGTTNGFDPASSRAPESPWRLPANPPRNKGGDHRAPDERKGR